MMPLYFIAILAPPKINEQVTEWKQYMKEMYGCKVALRSPAHITLIPPFNMKEEAENLMAFSMNQFVSKKKFKVELKNFSTFPPKVIFVNVKETKRLHQLKDELENFISDVEITKIKKEKRSFSPHITIATRDLKKYDFHLAWQFFREKQYSSSFLATGIVLLKNSNGWQVNKTAVFPI